MYYIIKYKDIPFAEITKEYRIAYGAREVDVEVDTTEDYREANIIKFKHEENEKRKYEQRKNEEQQNRKVIDLGKL